MSEESERDDPVLVRPYITTQPGGVTAGHDDRAVSDRGPTDREVERAMDRRFAGVPADDVELPPTLGGGR